MSELSVDPIQAWMNQRVAVFRGLCLVDRTYLVGLVLVLLTILAPLFGMDQEVSRAGVWASAAILAFGLVQETYAKVRASADSHWFKWLMVPVAIMIAALSLGSASGVVNEATGLDPSYFPRAVSFMAPLAALPVLAVLGVVGLGVGLLAMTLAWMFQLALTKAGEKPKESGWKWFGRIGGAICAMMLITPVTEPGSAFGQKTKDLAAWMAQGLDMHKDIECGPDEWDRILRVNDTLVIRAVRAEQGLTFHREVCPLGPAPRLAD